MNAPLVSIIIPVYNCEKYIHICAKHIIAQTYSNFEAIIINDGSTDNSGMQSELIADTDARFAVIHTANRGVSSARNIGIAQARGEFLVFLDADDYIAADYLEVLVQKTLEGEYDMVQCGYETVNDDNEVVAQYKSVTRQIDNSEEMIQELMNRTIFASVCAKIFKAEILKKVNFDESIAYGEDIQFNYNFCKKSQRIALISYLGYKYYQRDNSVEHSPIDRRHLQLVTISNQFLADTWEHEKTTQLICKNEILWDLYLFSRLCASTFFTTIEEKDIQQRLIKYYPAIRVHNLLSTSEKIKTGLIYFVPRLYHVMYYFYNKYIAHNF